MALVMEATMAILMLGCMRGMSPNQRLNLGSFAGSIAVCALGLWLVRSQATVDNVAWMKAMLPHHAIAILTSAHAHITDPRVRQLADGIIQTQREEIAAMKVRLADLQRR
jgi:uncharacterized protein (DUF305 family)